MIFVCEGLKILGECDIIIVLLNKFNEVFDV